MNAGGLLGGRDAVFVFNDGEICVKVAIFSDAGVADFGGLFAINGEFGAYCFPDEIVEGLDFLRF